MLHHCTRRTAASCTSHRLGFKRFVTRGDADNRRIGHLTPHTPPRFRPIRLRRRGQVGERGPDSGPDPGTRAVSKARSVHARSCPTRILARPTGGDTGRRRDSHQAWSVREPSRDTDGRSSPALSSGSGAMASLQTRPTRSRRRCKSFRAVARPCPASWPRRSRALTTARCTNCGRSADIAGSCSPETANSEPSCCSVATRRTLGGAGTTSTCRSLTSYTASIGKREEAIRNGGF